MPRLKLTYASCKYDRIEALPFRLRRGECDVRRRQHLLVRGGRAVQVTLGRERVRRAGGQHDVVGLDDLARGELHPPGIHLGRAVPDHPAVAEQPSVGQVDPRQPGRRDECPERGHVVHERVFRLDQQHLGHVVQGLGHVDSGVAAAEDGDDRFGLGRLAHLRLLFSGSRPSGRWGGRKQSVSPGRPHGRPGRRGGIVTVLDSFSLTGKKALVTGGNQGLGKAFAAVERRPSVTKTRNQLEVE